MNTRALIGRMMVTAALAAMLWGCSTATSSTGCERYDSAKRTSAMVILQALVQSWDAVAEDHAEVAPPASADLAWALEVLRCEDDARARSRLIRAIAKVLGHDWNGERSRPVLRELSFDDPAAIDAFKKRVVDDISKEAFTLYARDRTWLEYAILRHVTVKNDTPWTSGEPRAGLLAPATAWAQPQPTCWRPEEPFSNKFVDPYVRLKGHVSVDKNFSDSAKNIDAQQWDVCSKFWSPPDNSTPPVPQDGAQLVDKTWPSCTVPVQPLNPEATPPAPGVPYPTKHYLWERFFCPLKTGNAHFENVLAAWSFPSKRETANGTQVPSQRMSFRLGDCGNDDVKGAMGGGIGNLPLTVLLDSGFIEIWTEGGRTHVASLKDFALSDRGVNWLTQLNPALNELNDELGELACCLP
jgi:hypothetical protein